MEQRDYTQNIHLRFRAGAKSLKSLKSLRYFTFFIALLLSELAHANCLSPNAVIGSIDFQGGVFKYCDGSSWVALGGGSGDFLKNGTIAMTGNFQTGGNWISNDGGNEGVFVLANGRVGVGTATPSAALDVAGDLSFSGTLSNGGSTNGLTISSSGLATLTGGNSSTVQLFAVKNTSSALGSQANLGFYGGALGLGSINTTVVVNDADADMTFATMKAAAPTEKMRITADGNVGINQTSPLGQLDIITRGAAVKPLIIKAAASQTATLTEWQNSAGTALYTMDPSGTATANTDLVNKSFLTGYVGGGSSYVLKAGDSMTGALGITSNSANALAVGRQGTTDPALKVDASTASSATGLQIKSAAAAGGIALTALSSGANEGMSITSKGTGSLSLAAAGAGSVLANVNSSNKLSISSTSFTGQNVTNFQFDAGTASSTAATKRFLFSGAGDTALTASTEATSVHFDMSAIREHATGALALQRDFRISGTKHTAVGATTITNAAVLAIDPTLAGTNATLTNSSAIYVPTAAVNSGGAVTNSYGLNVAAASGATNNYAAAFTGGNVGIGTAAPNAPLDVALTSNSTLLGGNVVMRVTNDDTTNNNVATIRFASRDSGASPMGPVHIGAQFTNHASGSTAGDFYVATVVGASTNERLRVLSGGGMRLSPAALNGSPAAGDIAIDSGASNALKYHNGTTWVSLTGAGTGDFLKNGTLPMTGNFQTGGNWISNDGGNEGIAIDTAGNVGVGTTSPQAKLDVRGGHFALTDSNVTHGLTNLAPTNAYGHFSPHSTTDGGLRIKGITDASSSAIKLQATIGLTDPTDATAAIAIEGSKSDGSVGNAALGALETVLQISNYTTPAMTVLGSGNVGIGTVTPAAKLDVAYGDMNFQTPSWDSASTVAKINWKNDLGADISWIKGGNNAVNTGYLAFGVWNNVEAMRIMSPGYVGVGTNSPSAFLHVAPTAAANGTLTAVKVTGAANWAQTLSTEIPDMDLNFNRIIQWATGPLTTQRAMKIQPPTLSFVGASTVTDAATVGITGAPVEGGNANLINTHGLLIGAGAVSAATNSYGLTANAQTGATNNYAAQFLGGNVGIGTTSPGALLHSNTSSTTGNSVLEALRLSHEDSDSAGSTGIGAKMVFTAESNSAGVMPEAGVIEAVLDDAVNTSKDSSLRFYTLAPNSGAGTNTGVERLRITGNGLRVAASALPASGTTGDIVIDSGAANALKYYNGSAWVSLTGGGGSGDFLKNGTLPMTGNFQTGGNWISNDGGNEGLYVDTAGSVSVGNTSPSQKFHVSGNMQMENVSLPADFIVKAVSDTDWNAARTRAYRARGSAIGSPTAVLNSDEIAAWDMLAYSGGAYQAVGGLSTVVDAAPSGVNVPIRFVFETNDGAATATRMTIKSSGFVGINEVAPGAQLQINANAAGTKPLVIKAAASQTATLTEWQNSAGTALYTMDPSGTATANTDLITKSFLTGYVGGGSSYVQKAGDSMTGALGITSNSANAFAVGRQGTTDPALQVDASTASSVTGLQIKSAVASGSGVTLQAISSAADETLNIKAKGAGAIIYDMSSSSGSQSFNIGGSQKLTMSNTQIQGINLVNYNIWASAASSTASTTRFKFTGAADTALTAGTEAPSTHFDISQTRQHASNTTVALQRDFRLSPSTHSFASATGTITNAAGLAIDGPPKAGANAAITNSSALYIPTLALGAGVTNSYGLNVAAASGATNNYAAAFTGGYVGIGTAKPTGQLHIAATGASSTLYMSSHGAGFNEFDFRKSNNTEASPTDVVDTDMLGQMSFRGYRTNDYYIGAQVIATVDGTPSGLRSPTKLSFVLNDGSTGNIERMTLKPNGNVGIGTILPGALLHSNTSSTAGNSVLEALRLSHEDSDSAGSTGIGAKMVFTAESNSAGVMPEAGVIEAVLDDAVNTSKDSSLRFYTLAPNSGAGTNTGVERLRITGNGLRVAASALPASGTTGDIVIDSGAANALKYYNGSAWVALTGAGTGDFLKNGTLPMTGNFQTGGNWISNDGGNEGIGIDTAGNVGIGTLTPTKLLTVKGSGAAGEYLTIENDNDTGMSIKAATTAGNPYLMGLRSRGTVAAPANVASGDILLSVGSSAYAGGAWQGWVSGFKQEVDGTPGAGDVPVRLVFSTAPDGTVTQTERMRIDNAGLVGINSTGPGAQLEVKSSAAGTKGLIVKAAASPTASLTEWQDSAGAAIYKLDPSGVPAAATDLVDVGYLNTTVGNYVLKAGDSMSGALAITSNSANALAVGPAGTTNPTLQVDASTASAASGLQVKSAAAGGGVTLQAISSGANEPITIQAKGNGNAYISAPSATGAINLIVNGAQKVAVSDTSINLLNFVGFSAGAIANSTATTARFVFTGAADTNLTAATEAPSAYFNMGQTRQHASNTTVALQRDFRVSPSTHSFASASGNVTDAMAFSVDSPALAGTNATIANSHGIYVGTADVTPGTGVVTNAYGLSINAPSGATNNYAAQFMGGNVGIGTAAPAALLDVEHSSTAGTGSLQAGQSQMYIQPPAGSDTYGRGLVASSGYGGTLTSAAATITGLDGSAGNWGTGTVGTAHGVRGLAYLTAAGTISEGAGGYFSTNTGTGTITNAMGVKIGTILGTNKWSLYATDATAPSYFAGKVGVGTASPGVSLDVNGGVRAGDTTAVTACGSGAGAGEGTQRYNYTSHYMEYCNGTSWVSVNASSNVPTLVSTQTASNSATLQWTGLTGNNYRLVCYALQPATSAAIGWLQMGQGGTPTWLTANYAWATQYTGTSGGSTGGLGSASASGIETSYTVTNSNDGIQSLSADFTGLSQAVKHAVTGLSICSSTQSDPYYLRSFVGTYTLNTTAITAVRFLFSTGNITSGKCSLYAMP